MSYSKSQSCILQERNKNTTTLRKMHYFKEIINACGISLQFSDKPNVLLKESSLVVRDLKKELQQHENYPNNLTEFMNGLRNLIRKEKYFKKALLPSMDESDISPKSKQQDCIFRIFLATDCLQSQIMALLLEEVTKHVIDNDDDTVWLRLILRPLRYLSYINEPKILNKQLLEILEVATHPAQIEILSCIPEIIPDSEYQETAEKLVEILDKNIELTAAIVDCLNFLGLTAETKQNIQDRIISAMSMGNSLKTFPMMFHFLVSDCKPSSLPNVLGKTRLTIDAAMHEKATGDRDSEYVLAFQEIRNMTYGPNSRLTEAWLNIIASVRIATDHRPVDLIILFMLHSGSLAQRRAVEALFKKKSRLALIRSELVKETFALLSPQLFNDYLSSALMIGSSLLFHGSDQLGRAIFTAAFYYKYADNTSRRQVLEALVAWPSSGSLTAPTNGAFLALKLLSDLAASDEGVKLLRPHVPQLMGLLDKLETVELPEAAIMFQLLCSLGEDGIRDDLHIIIRKQLHSIKRCEQYRGVVAAVAAAAHSAHLDTSNDTTIDDNSSNVSYESISDLPEGGARQAAILLKLASDSTNDCPIARGLYYDRLAHIIVSSEKMNVHFLSWLVETVTSDFQSLYVTDTLPDSSEDIPLVAKYTLNPASSGTIVINIGEICMKNNQTTGTMIVLSPLFRLVRLLHQRHYSGSLENIDALLGCSVSMPEIDPDLGLSDVGFEDSKHVMNAVFYCINWFRELVSAFVTQKGNGSVRKVLSRIDNIIELEEMLVTFMKQMPEHKLPSSHFYNVNTSFTPQSEGSKVDKAKRKKNNKNLNETSTTQGSQTQGSKTGKKPAKEKEFGISFREMDTDIIVLLKLPLGGDGVSLSLNQFKFIMSDLVSKLRALFGAQSANLSHLSHTVKPEALVKDLVRLMPYVNGHLSAIVKRINAALERCDGIHDAQEMFQPEVTNLKTCLGLTLEAIALTLSWTGFHDSTHLPLLRDCLRPLMQSDGNVATQMCSAKQLAIGFVVRLMIISESCLTLQSAVSLVKIVQALCKIPIDQTVIKKKLLLLSGKLLERKWFTAEGLPETGALSSTRINTLMRAHVDGCDIATANGIISWVHSELPLLKTKDDHLSTFQCITKANFPILFRAICGALLDALDRQLETGKSNTQHLNIWRDTATTLHALTEIVKTAETSTNLNSYLKKTIGILKLFLSNALPIFEITLRTQSDRVYEILKMIQQTTRFVHNLCCHTKVTKDRGLVGFVPQIRQILETLMYRVKALLAANNCTFAFWMGNLKSKDLRGEEISSQSTARSAASDDEQEELPAESDSDVEIDAEPEQSTIHSDGDDSASEIF